MVSETKAIYTKEYFQERNRRTLDDIERNTPDEMKVLQNWCVHKSNYNKETKERKKIVLSCHSGQWASPADSETWTSFDKALAYARENNLEGLTFALEGSGLIGIDLDHCVKDGKRSQLAWDVLNRSAGSYAEKSMSGSGIHIFVKGSLDNLKNKNDAKGLEAYDKVKFISLTGKMISKEKGLQNCPDSLKSYLAENLGKKPERSQVFVGSVCTLSDDAVVERIRNSKKGAEFNTLYAGVDVTGNRSVTDMKMLNILAFFCDCDSNQMERIFKSSGLYRPEKRESYLRHSISKAIETLKERPSSNYFAAASKNRSTGKTK